MANRVLVTSLALAVALRELEIDDTVVVLAETEEMPDFKEVQTYPQKHRTQPHPRSYRKQR